jgi:hypothetical protein
LRCIESQKNRAPSVLSFQEIGIRPEYISSASQIIKNIKLTYQYSDQRGCKGKNAIPDAPYLSRSVTRYCSGLGIETAETKPIITKINTTKLLILKLYT